MEIRACELLCQLNSKGEEISTMLLSSDLSVQAGSSSAWAGGMGVWIAEVCHESDEHKDWGHIRNSL